MKKKRAALLLCACGLILLTGCGQGADRKDKADPAGTARTEETGSEESMNGAGTAAGTAAEEAAEDELIDGAVPRELKASELREFTDWINRGDHGGNYGFLLSEYDRPQDMDLSQVFYAGAGLDCEPLSPEEQAAYLKETGQEEIYTDCTRLTSEQIEEFLNHRLGLSYEDMTHPLDWAYLPEYDIYVWEHGDTNYMNFTCVSGRQTGADTYELDCVPGDDMYTPYLSASRLTLKKSKTDYQPVSNIYAEGLSYSMDIWRIEEQCFDVELEGWGAVSFVSYGPDASAYGARDVVFTLEKEGEPAYRLPSVTEENYLWGETFRQILAVSFKDYDGDGDKDIIIIAEYASNDDEAGEETIRKTRLYRNDREELRFVLDFDRMDVLDANQWNHTVDEIMEHVDETWRVEEE